MNRFISSFLTAGLALNSFATAAPTASKQTFSVEQVKNTNFTRNGAAALAKAYRKFGVAPPQALVAAASRAKAVHRRSTGSATTTPEDGDSEWLTPVQIGTPAQTFNLDFDTGSSDLWVFCTDASYSADGHTEYNPSNSSTSTKLSGASWSISYGDGSSSSGDVYHDKVSVGGLTVAAQAVEAATTVSSSFSSEANLDGLLGLGFSSINTVKPTQQKTFFDSAASQLGSKVFTADLKHNSGGKYNFGYIDTSAYTGDITYTDVDSSQGYWGFTSTGYQVGNNSFTSTSISGIADTGTTLLMLPEEVVKAYYAQVSGAQYDSSAGGYVFSCDADLPEFSFGVGSATITIPSEYMNYCSLESESSYGKRADGQFTEVIVEEGADGTVTTITSTATGISEAELENLLDGFGGGDDSSGFGGSDSSSSGSGYGGSSGGGSSDGGFGGGFGGGNSGSPYGTPTAAIPASTPVATSGYGGGSSSSGGSSSGGSSSSKLCYGGLQSSADIGINIFGDIALKAAFVVFDGASTRLGWAAKSLS